MATTVGVQDPTDARANEPLVKQQNPGGVLNLQPTIRPRADWAGDLPVTGEIQPEEEVRFLLVHHTASSNDYGADEVIGQIRTFYELHTGPDKGWPDVAYNFFVDRFGTIWEARSGSLDGPVRGDATGGSQGYALLCALIGDHSAAPISDEALGSLTQLLAWLAHRHDINTEPGQTVDFVSRGSNRWPEGAAVTARTISGHREMSTTTCPGDFAFSLLDSDVPRRVTEIRDATTATTTSSAATTTTSAAAATNTTMPNTTVAPTSTSTTTGTPPPPASGAVENSAGRAEPSTGSSLPQLALGGLAALLLAGTATIVRLRRRVEDDWFS